MTDATDLSPEVQEAVRDLTLVLADTKRLLGYRYAEWMLGAPELETGIACSSMAQDEWGHARLLYALMKGFDDDPEALEHGREPDAYRNMELLDAPAETWPEVVALMALADVAVTVQFEALRGSAYEPLAQRVEKVVDEERFHAAHGTAWAKRLAGGTDASHAALGEALRAALPAALAWFGPDSDRATALRAAGVVDASGGELRARFLERTSPVLQLVDVASPGEPELDGFDEARRRMADGGPDEETIRKIRGDRNRAFLMD
jgi:ring-1,2-phenylacetyl-CoA epoxidase subunit PaaC